MPWLLWSLRSLVIGEGVGVGGNKLNSIAL